MSIHTGGCQCGAVRYEVNMEVDKAMACNCSRCGRLGWLMQFVPATEFTLLQGEDQLTEYRFNKELIQHLFCKVCGIESFARGKGRDGQESVCVNLRCVDDLDVKSLPVTEFDGKSL